jgi:hypothetical protein
LFLGKFSILGSAFPSSPQLLFVLAYFRFSFL